jgi:adenylylsulfate kinase-like enzyme
MTKNKIIAIHGPAGIGKTAIAGKLCRKLPGKNARISIDYLRDMLCMQYGSGRMSDRYIVLAKKLVPTLTKELLEQGYNVIIEIAPPTLEDRGAADDRLVKKIKNMGGKVFFLHAPLDSVLKRNKKRRGEFGQGNLSRKLTEQLYKYCEQHLNFEDYILISTDKIGADKTTSLILEKI